MKFLLLTAIKWVIFIMSLLVSPIMPMICAILVMTPNCPDSGIFWMVFMNLLCCDNPLKPFLYNGWDYTECELNWKALDIFAK
jgi:hypothetical protein